jgi:uncharacterized protein (DUF433 family)
MQALLERITVDKEICSGKPTVRDTRVLVKDVWDALAVGIPTKEILTSWYPSLEGEDVKACKLYAESNPDKFPPEPRAAAPSVLRPQFAKKSRSHKIKA